MKLNKQLPLSDPYMSRIAAQAIVTHAFNMRAVVRELRPDITAWRPFSTKLMDEPAIRHEIEVIMSRSERNAAKFTDLMWDWLQATSDDKTINERRIAAARILAKGYINEKAPADVHKPFVIDGLGDGISNLTSADVVATDAKKKVM